MSTETTSESLTSDDRTMGALAHLSSFGAVIAPGIGHILGPLIVWMVKRDSSEYAAEHAKEALNFQITITVTTIVAVIGGLLTLGIGFLAAIPLIIVIGLLDLVCTVIAALKAYDGQSYRYPMTLRWI